MKAEEEDQIAEEERPKAEEHRQRSRQKRGWREIMYSPFKQDGGRRRKI